MCISMKISRLLAFAVLITAASCQAEEPIENGDQAIDSKLLVELVNEVRLAGCNCGDEYMPPAGKVVWNAKLAQAAQSHSEYQFANETLTHTGKNGTSIGDRATQAGYEWSSVGENVAMGYKDEKLVVQGWLKSPGHCKNIMNKSFTDMGVGKKGDYWTQLFAKPLATSK
jgi:uncharacterized protein YkwD